MTSTIRKYPGNIDVNVSTEAYLGTEEYQRDAFGRLRVSNPFTLLDFNHVMGDLNIIMENKTENGGTITESSGSYLDLNVTDTSGSLTIRQTREYIAYQSGKSKLVYLTGILATNLNNTGIISRIGSFDDNNGIFFEYNNGTINIVERSHGVDNRIPRSSWTDKLDGNGASGKTVSFDKAQIFTTDFEWLGVGQVRVGIVIDGIFRPCYIFRHSGDTQVTQPYIKYAKLPLRYEIKSLGSSNSCRMICGSVQSEGGFAPLTKSFTKSFSYTDAFSTTVYRPLITLSLKEATSNFDYNRGTLKVKGLEFLITNGGYAEYKLIRNADISNNSGATYSDVDTSNSFVRYKLYDSTDTVDPDSGFLIKNGYLERRTTGSFINDVNELFASVPIVSDIDDNPDTVTLAIRKITSTNPDIYGNLSWVELDQ